MELTEEEFNIFWNLINLIFDEIKDYIKFFRYTEFNDIDVIYFKELDWLLHGYRPDDLSCIGYIKYLISVLIPFEKSLYTNISDSDINFLIEKRVFELIIIYEYNLYDLIIKSNNNIIEKEIVKDNNNKSEIEIFKDNIKYFITKYQSLIE